MRRISLAQVIEAIELNGYEQGFGHAFEHNDERTYIKNACAIGQAALNLGVNVTQLLDTLGNESVSGRKNGTPLMGFIIDLNDAKKLAPKEIAERLRKEVKKPERTIDLDERMYTFTNWQGIKV